MALTQLSPPFPIFTDRTGRPLDGGYLYFGEVDQDPETAPITVYFDSDLTQPAVQPLRTSAGYVMRDNAPALLYAASRFSVTVKDKQERLVIYAPSTFGLFDETGLLFAENNLSDVDDADTAIQNIGGVNLLGLKGVTTTGLVNRTGAGTFATVPLASKVQAEVGTNNNTYMTPLRNAEARQANAGGVLLGPFATTAVTSATATGIPSWATQIDVLFDGVSTSVSANIFVRIGPSGGVEDTGYVSSSSKIVGSTSYLVRGSPSGFIVSLEDASSNISGIMSIVMGAPNSWYQQHSFGRPITTSDVSISGGGRKITSGAITQISLNVLEGAFDNGSFTVRCR